jgi:hypothetical protein
VSALTCTTAAVADKPLWAQLLHGPWPVTNCYRHATGESPCVQQTYGNTCWVQDLWDVCPLWSRYTARAFGLHRH